MALRSFITKLKGAPHVVPLPPATKEPVAPPSLIDPVALSTFLDKLKGVPGAAPQPPPSRQHVALSLVGAMMGVGTLTMIHRLTGSTEATTLLTSSGATAILLFGAPTVPFSQPRNVIGGHLVAAISGTATHALLGDFMFTPAISVGLAVAGMQLTSTMHPPAGGTALVAAISGHSSFFLVPVFIGSVAQVGVACVFNNMVPGRRYPQHW